MVEKPKFAGVVAMVLDPDGDVVVTLGDFNRTIMGGCTLEESQTYRVRDWIKGRFFDAMTMGRFRKGAAVLVDRFWDMAEANGFRIITVPVSSQGEEGTPMK